MLSIVKSKETRSAIDSMTPVMMRVSRIRRETPNTFTMEISVPADDPFFFEPGQFNMVGLLGVGEVPLSICGDSDRPDILVHTMRTVGTVTSALRKVRPGDWVTIRGPFGRPWPLGAAKGRDMVLICGGIGLAPIRPVVYSVFKDRMSFGRFAVLYGTRAKEDIVYKRELARWQKRKDFELMMTLDRGQGVWRGNVGALMDLVSRLTVDPSDAVAMVCGNEYMMRFVVKSLVAQGFDPELIYVSLERNMKCGIGHCGHCQLGGELICRSGPVFRYSEVARMLSVREL